MEELLLPDGAPYLAKGPPTWHAKNVLRGSQRIGYHIRHFPLYLQGRRKKQNSQIGQLMDLKIRIFEKVFLLRSCRQFFFPVTESLVAET
jgi:hypothetical protein